MTVSFVIITGSLRSYDGEFTATPSPQRRLGSSFQPIYNIKPQVERLPMSKINEAFSHLKAGDAHYRIVLSND
jgi:uncharacterized zinc-type alcohol dehydrogenase-like protein